MVEGGETHAIRKHLGRSRSIVIIGLIDNHWLTNVSEIKRAIVATYARSAREMRAKHEDLRRGPLRMHVISERRSMIQRGRAKGLM